MERHQACRIFLPVFRFYKWMEKGKRRRGDAIGSAAEKLRKLIKTDWFCAREESLEVIL